MTKKQLAASILNADFSCLREVLSMLEKNKVDLVHLDIMDGNFVPNITFGPKIVATIRKNTNLPLSVHLMVEKPERYIKDFSEVINKQDSLIIHVETCPHLDKTLQMILDCGLKAGVALNPSTPLEMIKYVLDKLNIILIMTVNPGFGGQQFIPSMLLKIADAREIIEQSEKDIAIQVDGGINSKNIVKVKQAGANILVVGSEIFKAQYPEKVIENIQKILKLS
ncbi:MAG: ribulose-phosphate 3-epimerase [Candidatus Atribacteria bacterium]|nr:ribulose-phosphate 3-epimerase [Candidatus Atribacteria bacterium]